MPVEHDQLPFSPVEGTTPAHDVAVQLRDAILSGTVRADEQLPPERQLAEVFRVSRCTVRDAIRTLQTQGLVRVRVGAKGGTFATSPPPGLVAEHLTHMLALAELTPAEITEARLVIELGALPLACRRATDADLAELERLCDAAEAALRDGVHDFHHSVSFHVALARASHSPATALVIDALHEPLLRSMIRAAANAPHMAEQGIADHRALVAALREQDIDAAHAVLARHLGRTLERSGGDTSVVPLVLGALDDARAGDPRAQEPA